MRDQVTGARLDDRAHPSPDAWRRIVAGIVKRGFVVEYRDLEPPRTGIFNGLSITIDPDVDFEMQCFILLHLFGHSVQWLAPSLSERVAEVRDSTNRDWFIRVLYGYEMEAAQFGLQLLHEVGIDRLDQWYSDFVHTDWHYVERYYRTGELDWDACVVSGRPLIIPESIPSFTQREVEVRFAF